MKIYVFETNVVAVRKETCMDVRFVSRVIREVRWEGDIVMVIRRRERNQRTFRNSIVYLQNVKSTADKLLRA